MNVSRETVLVMIIILWGIVSVKWPEKIIFLGGAYKPEIRVTSSAGGAGATTTVSGEWQQHWTREGLPHITWEGLHHWTREGLRARRQEEIPLPLLSLYHWPALALDGSLSNAHGREAILVSILLSSLHNEQWSEEAHTHAHRRKAIFMPLLSLSCNTE